MRKRTARSRSNGSMWMSLARSFTAWKSSELTSRMIGASSLGLEQVARLLELGRDQVEALLVEVRP